jgi:hypothetical protein
MNTTFILGLLLLLAQYGNEVTEPTLDVNNDGLITTIDLLAYLTNG